MYTCLNKALRTLLSITLVVFFLISSHRLSAQIISTYAGNGSTNESGDGALAAAAGVPHPYGICVDAAGNLYITGTHKVRKVNATTGIITTVAGTGSPGFSGDGGPALNARMQFTNGVCVDLQGNIYVTEYTNQRIRKITAATGIITTIAGNGTAGYSGDNGPSVSATVNVPKGICVDASGNVYFADLYNSRVRKISASGIISTIAGTGVTAHSGDGGPAQNAGVPTPVNVCLDAAGTNLFIVETSGRVSCRVRKVNLATGIITTVAGTSSMAYSGDGGPATSASLFDPSAVCVDGSGNIYITTYDDARIRKVDAATGIITTIAGTGSYGYNGDCIPATTASFDRPTGMCIDSRGNLYIADNFNSRIREISTSSYTNSPEVTVAASDTVICPGGSITFTATNKSGNRFPVYQWMVDGRDVGTNSTVYTTSALTNGSVVQCRMTVPHCSGGSTKDFLIL